MGGTGCGPVLAYVATFLPGDIHDGLMQGELAGRTVETGSRFMRSNAKALPGSGNDREDAALRRKLVGLQAALAEKEAVIRHLMQHVESQKLEVARGFLDGIDQLVLPPLMRLKQHVSRSHRAAVDAIIGHLKELGTPFVERLGRDLAVLSPTERRICSLVRQGLSAKEIASAEEISISTVSTHRRNIRRKLGLGHTRINLASLLTARRA